MAKNSSFLKKITTLESWLYLHLEIKFTSELLGKHGYDINSTKLNNNFIGAISFWLFWLTLLLDQFP